MAMERSSLSRLGFFGGAILAAQAGGGKAHRLGRRATLPVGSAQVGTALAAILLGRQEDTMIKALLTPIILGLAVAMVIRLAMPRRAY
jgi:hypothetical protein